METNTTTYGLFTDFNSGTVGPTYATYWPPPSSAAVISTPTYPYTYSPDPLMKKPVEAETDPLVWLRRRVEEICWQPPSR